MDTKAIITTVGNAVRKFGFKLRKHSPEIMIIGGAIGVVGSCVMACVATTKLDDVVEEHNETIENIRKEANDPDANVPEKEQQKKVVATYFHTGVEIVKLYGPSVTLGTLSLATMLASNGILRRRNMSLAAAFATVNGTFKDYRARVAEEFGEEVEKRIRFGFKAHDVDETIIDAETGEVETVKATVYNGNPHSMSDYARCFDQVNCPDYWENDADYNMMFLQKAERFANDKLRAQKYLFLNDVYKMLGFSPTRAGQCVGWIYDPECPAGDNYIDFGIFRPENSRFVDRNENCVWLDFNVDGDILNDFEL